MSFGLEVLGLFGWILIIIILLICCSSVFLCCIEIDEDLMTSSRERGLESEKPYDPRADGTVDMGPMLFSSHFYSV